MDVAITLLDDAHSGPFHTSADVGGVAVDLEWSTSLVFGEKIATLEMHSQAQDGQQRALCMGIFFHSRTNEYASEIEVARIGTTSEDTYSNPCLVPHSVLSAWLKVLSDWNKRHQKFEIWSISDEARLWTAYRSESGSEVLCTPSLLTPSSLLTHGMPFYTLEEGLFPIATLEASAETRRIYCEQAKGAVDMGATPLVPLLHELAPEAAATMVRAIRLMR